MHWAGNQRRPHTLLSTSRWPQIMARWTRPPTTTHRPRFAAGGGLIPHQQGVAEGRWVQLIWHARDRFSARGINLGTICWEPRGGKREGRRASWRDTRNCEEEQNAIYISTRTCLMYNISLMKLPFYPFSYRENI